ncbi:hypothetical protein AK830_g6178 [Neonectria ditissima]|uniref:Uncharacterized protein n=1 Tax=Neonectria ditissima TaxID=78410 RepID=A0A0P7ARE6_9HYPO|nr:hypothetical protein AK830_g6178 [Neonectria ditissima]
MPCAVEAFSAISPGVLEAAQLAQAPSRTRKQPADTFTSSDTYTLTPPPPPPPPLRHTSEPPATGKLTTEMGPPRTRRALSVMPSRFQEGSMNDRTSAAPPVHFLEPGEREALELPAMRSHPRPVSDDWADKQVKKGRLLGQVWDGVRGRLGLKREPDDEKGSRKRERSRKGDRDENRRDRSSASDRSRHRDRSRGRERKSDDRTKGDQEEAQKEAQKDEMPTREEILANYHHLVNSGFFTSHAIQSTRQPPPGSASSSAQDGASSASSVSRAPPRSYTPQPPPPPRAHTPATRPKSSSAKHHPTPKQRSSHEQPQSATYDELVASGFFSPPTARRARKPSPSPAAPAPVVGSTRSSRDFLQPPTPRWSSRAGTPSASRAQSPMPSPASASSRGTKRAATDNASDDEDNDDTANDPPTPKKRLRKSPSRDMAIPKLRNVASRRALLPRRSVSGPHSSSREYNKLARRVLGRLPGGNARGSNDTPDRRGSPAARRCASGESKAPLQESYYTRVLRPRRSAAETLCVVPNANRGIPKVPVIPEKFVTCEDRENGAPYLALHL